MVKATQDWGDLASAAQETTLKHPGERSKAELSVQIRVFQCTNTQRYRSTVDREIFALKIFRPSNFCIKNISSFDGSTT